MTEKTKRIEPRLPRGFEDRLPAEIAAVDAMIQKIKAVYERYGFDPVETPLFEYTEALGKFLPDTDRPNAGVFSLQDDDEQWLSLRYDLTAPLARHFAQNFNDLPKPYRSYRAGYVFRNEKPGPGRFRQFMQFDADTVGAAGPEADAEMCMMMADTMDALGLAGKYVVKVNNRKVLDGILDKEGIVDEEQRLLVLRSIDKIDRVGFGGLFQLLTAGRTDESGDRTKGAGLTANQAGNVMRVGAGLTDSQFLAVQQTALTGTPERPQSDPVKWTEPEYFSNLRRYFEDPAMDVSGINDLETISRLCRVAGYDESKIRIDPSVVRGLEYYTGPVFEIELTFAVQNEKGQDVVFGSVGGGGRYDGLVSRFRSEPVPATGFSIGVSRLANALKMTGNLQAAESVGPVVVLVLDKDQTPRYQAITSALRNAGIRAEMFMGSTKNFGKQVAYADKRNAPAVIIEGSQERAAGKVQIKDLIAGKLEAAAIKDNATYKSERPGQFECDGDIAAIVQAISDLPAIKAALERRN